LQKGIAFLRKVCYSIQYKVVILVKIGDKIKARRIELGLSVDELAEKIGKNRSTVYRYENKEIENLPTSILNPLVKALQVPPDYFVDWEDFPTADSSEISPEAAETASMIHEAENTEEIITIVETVIEDEDYRAIVTASKELSPDEMKMVRAMIEGLVNKKE
jgi:transcriptional regulator with XRE-family HTH domain